MFAIHESLSLEHDVSAEYAKQSRPILERACFRSCEHELAVFELGNCLQPLDVGPMAYFGLGIGPDDPCLLKKSAPMSHLSFVAKHLDCWQEC
jgi:hypothetical protein